MRSLIEINEEILVKNAEGEGDTQANIIVKSDIDYEPKVSVIIPVYNVEKYLKECLDSVINQTLKEIEIICVDDGSTDSSLEILKEYASKDTRFTIITQKNLYAGVARNAGLTVAKGKYLSFLDSDDWFELNMLEDMYNMSVKENSDVVICNYNIFDNLNKTFTQSYRYKEDYIVQSPLKPINCNSFLYFIAPPNAWTKLFKTEIVKTSNTFFENTQSCNDITFVNTILSIANSISITNASYINYRINSNINISTNREEKALCILKALKKLELNLKRLNVYDTFSNLFAKVFISRTIGESLKCNTKQKEQFSLEVMQLFSKELYEKYKKATIPFVSVIIPIYNAAEHLETCLDSIINQTLTNIEIICINDGSTDSSAKILDTYAQKDGRIKVIHQENAGAAPARNAGIELAQGQYITFIDADDWVDLNYFEKLYNSAKQSNSDIAATSKVALWSSQKIAYKFMGLEENQTKAQTIDEKGKIIIATGVSCNKIYKNSFLRKNNIKFPTLNTTGEDNYFTDLAVIMSNNISVIDDVCYYYRQISSSQTKTLKNKKHYKIIDIYKQIDEKISKLDISNSKKEKWFEILDIRKQRDISLHYEEMGYEYKEEFATLVNEQFPKIKLNLPVKNLIVSLTSYPARIGTVHQTIESILNQSMKADKVILWLAPEQFPNKEQDLPQELLELTKRGLTIDWYHDIRPYKKLIPTLIKHPNNIIITVDDDVLYDKKCIETLYQSHIKHKNSVICHRGHYILCDKNKNILPYKKWRHDCNFKKPTYNILQTGVGAVLYPPNCFYKDILNEKLFMDLTYDADDLWFWAMALLKGTKIYVAKNKINKINYIDGTQETALWHQNVDNSGNDKKLQKLIKHYPTLLHRLKKKYPVNSFSENIFSIKNIAPHKVITVLGLKLKLKNKKFIQREQMKQLEQKINNTNKQIKSQQEQIQAQQEILNKYQEQTKLELNRLKQDYNQKIYSEKAKLMYKLHKYLPEDKYPEALKDWFFEATGEVLDLENPQTFNEKIQWLKLYDSTPEKTRLADKYLVRDWVKEKIGEEYLIPLLGVYDKFDDIDFDILPDQFVLKCNHGSGYNIVVSDKSKFDKEDARKKINTWMNEDFAFRAGFEMQYSDIPRKIIAEEYIQDIASSMACDYHIHCFNGTPYVFYVTNMKSLDTRVWSFYDVDLNPIPLYHDKFSTPVEIKMNDNIRKMLNIAEILSQNLNYVRVDMYCTDKVLYFGEMTFTPSSGIGRYIGEYDWKNIWGSMIKLEGE